MVPPTVEQLAASSTLPRNIAFQMVQVAIPRKMFDDIL
jgi:hypothetical protein